MADSLAGSLHLCEGDDNAPAALLIHVHKHGGAHSHWGRNNGSADHGLLQRSTSQDCHDRGACCRGDGRDVDNDDALGCGSVSWKARHALSCGNCVPAEQA